MRELTEKVFTCQYDKCQSVFFATRTAKYCSPRCRVAAHRLKQKPSLLVALTQKHSHMIEKWNVVRSASTYAEKMIIETFNRYGLDAALLAIGASYGVQANEMVITEEQHQVRETLEAEAILEDEVNAWWLAE